MTFVKKDLKKQCFFYYVIMIENCSTSELVNGNLTQETVSALLGDFGCNYKNPEEILSKKVSLKTLGSLYEQFEGVNIYDEFLEKLNFLLGDEALVQEILESKTKESLVKIFSLFFEIFKKQKECEKLESFSIRNYLEVNWRNYVSKEELSVLIEIEEKEEVTSNKIKILEDKIFQLENQIDSLLVKKELLNASFSEDVESAFNLRRKEEINFFEEEVRKLENKLDELTNQRNELKFLLEGDFQDFQDFSSLFAQKDFIAKAIIKRVMKTGDPLLEKKDKLKKLEGLFSEMLIVN